MPNHVMNVVTFNGSNKRVQGILEAIKADEIGYGSIDFNKIDPMPTELNIESGSKTNEGLKYYKDFVYVYTAFAKRTKDELLNIPKEKEGIFLRIRKDIDRKAWELGRQAYRNELKYGAPTWYEWTNKHCGTPTATTAVAGLSKIIRFRLKQRGVAQRNLYKNYPKNIRA